MLPTICQSCGGRITRPENAGTIENPNICATCAEAFEEPEPATVQRRPSRRALRPPPILHDDRLQEVI